MTYEYMIKRGGLGDVITESIGGRIRERFVRKDEDDDVCGGVACPNSGERVEVRQDPDDYLSFANAERDMRERGCSIQCTEGGAFYYCCPPGETEESVAASFTPTVMRVMFPQDLTPHFEQHAAPPPLPPPPPRGFPWVTVSIVTLLGLGAAGFAGYWFWWRKRGEAE